MDNTIMNKENKKPDVIDNDGFYHFRVLDAIRFGVDEAIMVANFRFWIQKNKANNKHFYKGRYWTYNSYKAFSELFPFWSGKQIRRILQSLIHQEVIITNNFNKTQYDKTKWYAFKDENLL